MTDAELYTYKGTKLLLYLSRPGTGTVTVNLCQTDVKQANNT